MQKKINKQRQNSIKCQACDVKQLILDSINGKLYSRVKFEHGMVWYNRV